MTNIDDKTNAQLKMYISSIQNHLLKIERIMPDSPQLLCSLAVFNSAIMFFSLEMQRLTGELDEPSQTMRPFYNE